MPSNDQLESKVATIEANLEATTRGLSDLITNVREVTKTLQEQSLGVQGQIKDLVVAITAVAGPRKTDWQLVLGFIGLIMAVGAAALSPIYIQIKNSSNAVNQLSETFSAHTQLKAHPVGETRIEMLEANYKDQVNTRERLSLLEQEIANLKNKP